MNVVSSRRSIALLSLLTLLTNSDDCPATKAHECHLIYLDEDAFVMLYKSLARSHLEYANSVWNPHRLGLIKDLEKVQMRATKLVISIKT